MMEVPQLHGFGPAANRLLEAYKMLLKVPNANIFALKISNLVVIVSCDLFFETRLVI